MFGNIKLLTTNSPPHQNICRIFLQTCTSIQTKPKTWGYLSRVTVPPITNERIGRRWQIGWLLLPRFCAVTIFCVIHNVFPWNQSLQMGTRIMTAQLGSLHYIRTSRYGSLLVPDRLTIESYHLAGFHFQLEVVIFTFFMIRFDSFLICILHILYAIMIQMQFTWSVINLNLDKVVKCYLIVIR